MRPLLILVSLTPYTPPTPMPTKRFEELFELTYCHELEFANWEVERYLKKQCERAHKRGAIGQAAIWLGKLHAKQLVSGTTPPVSIRWIHEEIGYGVFAEEPLSKWSFIGEYTGLLRRRNLFFPNINDYCFMYPKLWMSLKAFTIDSQKHGNHTRFINHSDTPNCESVSVLHEGVFHVIVRAIKPIAVGEELTYDYGSIYWHNRRKVPLDPI